MRSMAIPGEKDGVLSEYCTYVTSMTSKLPDNVSTTEGGLMEPLAVVMHVCELSNAKLGGTAVVLDAECIDLVTLMSLRARGVSEMYVADMLDKRLEKVRKLGVARILNSRNENIKGSVNLHPLHKDEVIKAVIKMQWTRREDMQDRVYLAMWDTGG